MSQNVIHFEFTIDQIDPMNLLIAGVRLPFNALRKIMNIALDRDETAGYKFKVTIEKGYILVW